ncbi:MAG TPA: hypothetical protein PLL20_02210 [Phycisphaerae bacterium]|nr:hypothetical protein [Phycisphaerae bacterium]
MMWRRLNKLGPMVVMLVSLCFGAVCTPNDDENGGEVDLRDFSLPVPLFAGDSAWNQRADQVSVLPESDQQVLALYRVLLGDKTSLRPAGTGLTQPFPFMFVNYDEYSIPIFEIGDEQQSVLLRDYEGNPSGLSNPKLPPNPDDTVLVPAPAGIIRPSGPASTDADGHLVLYSTQMAVEYDFWNATTIRNVFGRSLGGGRSGAAVLAAGAIDFFDVHGRGTNNDGLYSARATGTPLLAGLILPEDVESGQIAHALAFAIPGPRNTAADPTTPSNLDYVYPASTTETVFYSVDSNALAAGQRIRLKTTIVDDEGETIDESQLAPITQMFLEALRTYGAYLVDNAGSMAFSAEDIHSANLDMTDDEVNDLISQPTGTPLPTGKTRWQVVIEKLNEELELIPVAWSANPNQSAATATFDVANIEVVENATVPPG